MVQYLPRYRNNYLRVKEAHENAFFGTSSAAAAAAIGASVAAAVAEEFPPQEEFAITGGDWRTTTCGRVYPLPGTNSLADGDIFFSVGLLNAEK